MAIARAGDTIQLVGRDNKYFIVRLAAGARLDTHRGYLAHDGLIGSEYGTEVYTHLGHSFYLLEPSTDDLIREIKRSSQIIYPKDGGFILMKLAVKPGQTVLEAGSGSGGMTTMLAQSVGPTGRVVSYEIRDDMQRNAQRNIERAGLADRVTFKLRDIAEGFDETDVDAFFLDVPNPWDYTGQVRRALKGGGFFGCILPTTNQVSTLLVALERDGYEFIEVCELLLRYYKPVPERLRPADRMVAHTGFLIFGRPINRRPRPIPAAEEAALGAEAEIPVEAEGADAVLDMTDDDPGLSPGMDDTN
jgi:tRNA (adenine57-N1/adenine58-N1)-methyltransferase catalytic subunit